MREPKDYLELGYEDVGYASPELSSDDTYPDYIKEEVERCVREIQKHQSNDTVTFAFITDIHYALTHNHKIRIKRTVNAYKEISKRTHIDKLILGGDYTNEGCKEYKSACYRELRAELDGLEYFPINGNHDDGTIWDFAYIKSPGTSNHLTHEEQYNLFYNHLPSLGAEFDKINHGLYYLYDDKRTKTRYIFMDACDIPYIRGEDGFLKYKAQWLFTISQNQYDWLINTGLKFNEEGWNVIFFAHSVALPSRKKAELGDIRIRMSILKELIEAYKTGSIYCVNSEDEELSVKINVDFSKYVRADVVGVFAGDFHMDKIEFDDAETPYILTANSVTYDSGSATSLKRVDGDKTELLFDIATIDRNLRKIYITRVGAGKEREADY